jgi:hypothetical protein
MATGYSQSRALLIAAIWTLFAGIGFCFILSVCGLTVRGGLLVAIAASLMLPLAMRHANGSLDLFEPLVTANFVLAVMFVGRPLGDLITGETIHLGYDVLPTFDEALLVALVGVGAFQLGYWPRVGRTLARRWPKPPAFNPRLARFAAWGYVGLGAALFSLFLATQGGIGLLVALMRGRGGTDNDNLVFLSSTGYFYNGILLFSAAALVFFALAILTRRRRYFLEFAATALVTLFFFGSRGDRSQALPLLMAVPTFWYLWRDRRPRARTVVLVLLAGLLVSGWQRETRTADTASRTALTDSLIDAISAPVSSIGDTLTGADAEMFDTLANFLLVVPEAVPFEPGLTVRDVLLRAVPRPLWPDKPGEGGTAVFEILWPGRLDQSRAAAASSILGSLYLDSGLLSVALGMFLIGALSSALWAWSRRHERSAIAQMIYAMGLPFVVILMRGNIQGTLARMLFLLVPLVLLLWLTRFRFGPKSQRLRYRLQLNGGSKSK